MKLDYDASTNDFTMTGKIEYFSCGIGRTTKGDDCGIFLSYVVSLLNLKKKT